MDSKFLVKSMQKKAEIEFNNSVPIGKPEMVALYFKIVYAFIIKKNKKILLLLDLSTRKVLPEFFT